MTQKERFPSQTPSAGSVIIAHILKNGYMGIVDARLISASSRNEQMTANEMIKLLDSLSESAKEKQIVFCHNPSKDVCDEYVPEFDNSCAITKNDITIYIKKVDNNEK